MNQQDRRKVQQIRRGPAEEAGVIAEGFVSIGIIGIQSPPLSPVPTALKCRPDCKLTSTCVTVIQRTVKKFNAEEYNRLSRYLDQM